MEEPPRNPVLCPDGRGAGREQRPEARRDLGQAVGLERDEYNVGCGDSRKVASRARTGGGGGTGKQHPDTMLGHRREVLAPGDQGDIRAAARERGSHVGAYRPGAEHGESHWPAARPATNAATRRRCTLPVGVRGISGKTWITAGTLNAASCSLQCSIRSLASVSCARVTAAATSSPYLSSSTPKQTASRTAGWDMSTCSISAGAMFSPPRMIISLSRPARER